jgi:hypothetical protein
MLYRDDEPTCLIRWDTNNESCAAPTAANERMTPMRKSDFDVHVAFETYPVITMDEYRERDFSKVGITR